MRIEPIALAALLAAGSAAAQPAALLHEPLAVAPDYNVTLVPYDLPPNPKQPATTIGTAGHRHPASVYAYVASGEVVSRLGDGPEKHYRAGEAWSETPLQPHYIVNASATEPARVVVLFVAPKSVTALSEPLPK